MREGVLRFPLRLTSQRSYLTLVSYGPSRRWGLFSYVLRGVGYEKCQSACNQVGYTRLFSKSRLRTGMAHTTPSLKFSPSIPQA